MNNLLRLSRALPHHLPLAKATFYKWHHLKKNPQIFRKLGGALFLDLAALQELIDKGQGA